MRAAQATPAAGRDHQDLLRDLNEGFITSVQQADVEWFRTHMAEDFLNSNPDGTIVDKAGFLARIAKGPGISGLKAEDAIIRVFGDFAIIHAKTTYKMADGRDGSGRYTDSWARRQGRWVCIAAHVTRC